MPDSIFSYSLSRPYPYRWFTWFVFIGGLAATVVFTAINLAADGYNISTVYSTTPNKTTEDNFWFQKKPWSWASKITSTCQPQTIAVGSNFYTDKLALSYNIDGITSESNGLSSQRSSFAYLNVYLDCNIYKMDITGPDGAQAGTAPVQVTATTYAACFFNAESGVTQFNISTSQTFDDSDVIDSDVSIFLTEQPETQPSVFWGQGLMNVYCRIFLDALLFPTQESESQADVTAGASASFRFGYRAGFQSGRDTMTRTIDVFDSTTGAYARGGSENDAKNATGVSSGYNSSAGITEQPLSPADWMAETELQYLQITNSTFPATYSWMKWVNGYAKVVYCTVLSDLGQSDQNNMLAAPDTGQIIVMQLFELFVSLGGVDISASNSETWATFSQWVRSYTGQSIVGEPPLDNNTAFLEFFGTSAPHHSPSVISEQYLCQVPVRKPWGSLLVSVLVADLVFLQVLWKVVNLIATFMVQRGDEDTKHCLGCAKRQHGDYEKITTPSTASLKPSIAIASDRQIANLEISDDEWQSIRLRAMPRKAVAEPLSQEV